MKDLVAMDSTAAKSWFALELMLDMQGDYEKARQAYIVADDLDQSRLRVTEEMNHLWTHPANLKSERATP